MLICVVIPGILHVFGTSSAYTPRTGFVSLLFDDGHAYHYTHMFPILEAHGLKGSFGIITEDSPLGIEGAPGRTQEMYLAGHEIQDHSTRHTYRWATHVDTVDDEVIEWVEYTFADVATWDSLCRRSLFILDSLGIETTCWNHPNGSLSIGQIPGHPDWRWLGDVNDSLFDVIAGLYRYGISGGVWPSTAHLNLRGHNFPDRFPFFNVPHVTIDARSLGEIKTGIADAAASGLWYLAASHGRDSVQGAKIDSLAAWLNEHDIEVLRCCEGWQRLYYGKPDPLANQIPQAAMLTDIDGNGKPDGYTGACSRDTLSAAPSDSVRCMRVFGDAEFFCYGPEVGPNAFSLWLKSATGSAEEVKIIWAKMDFDWAYLEDLWTTVQAPLEWVKIDTTTSSHFSIQVEDEVDRLRFTIRVAEGDTVLVAFPELLLAPVAGIPPDGGGDLCGSHCDRLRIFPNPVRLGGTLCIEPAAEVALFDILGRRVLRACALPQAEYVTLSTSGLAPGLYLVKPASTGEVAAKVVICR
jgi:hypothetical protein